MKFRFGVKLLGYSCAGLQQFFLQWFCAGKIRNRRQDALEEKVSKLDATHNIGPPNLQFCFRVQIRKPKIPPVLFRVKEAVAGSFRFLVVIVAFTVLRGNLSQQAVSGVVANRSVEDVGVCANIADACAGYCS